MVEENEMKVILNVSNKVSFSSVRPTYNTTATNLTDPSSATTISYPTTTISNNLNNLTSTTSNMLTPEKSEKATRSSLRIHSNFSGACQIPKLNPTDPEVTKKIAVKPQDFFIYKLTK